MDYQILKHAHAGLAYLSVSLFAVRAALSYLRPAALHTRALRIAPHLIDTALLAAAITLAVMAGLSPHTQPWLAAKLVALLAYIGAAALSASTPGLARWRAVVLLAALAMPLYMIAVAKSKLVWPF